MSVNAPVVVSVQADPLWRQIDETSCDVLCELLIVKFASLQGGDLLRRLGISLSTWGLQQRSDDEATIVRLALLSMFGGMRRE